MGPNRELDPAGPQFAPLDARTPDVRRDRDPREPVEQPARREPADDPNEPPLQPPAGDPADAPGAGEPLRREPDPKEPARRDPPRRLPEPPNPDSDPAMAR
jgi:hypothetical protein